MPARDYSAFTTPVSREEVAEFRRSSEASGRFGADRTTVVAAIVLGAVFVIVGAVVASVFGTIAASAGNPVLVPVVVGIVVIVVIGMVILGLSSTKGRWERRLRQFRFAEANELAFSSGESAPDYPGAIFGHGSGRRVEDHYFSASGRTLDFGNYRYSTGSGKNRSTHRWGFLAMKLDRALPHMVLDSTANNGLFGGTNLPKSFGRDQVLSLEGDFDRYFRLYCPREYERDALYVFTPDLMALLIDNAAHFDVEIVDDWLFVYSSTTVRMDDPATIEQLLRIVDTVGAKTLSQTDRYADDRASSPGASPFAAGSGTGGRTEDGRGPAGTVAPEGRRLRRGFPVAIGALLAAVAAYWILNLVFVR